LKPLIAVYFILLVAAPFEFLPPLLQGLRRGAVELPAARAFMWWVLALLVWGLWWEVAWLAEYKELLKRLMIMLALSLRMLYTTCKIIEVP
jgi:hypothetical protein